MPTQMAIKKFNEELEAVRENVDEIKHYLFSPLKDSEGGYRNSFVKKMLVRASGQGPFYRFTGKDSFLKHVRNGK